MNNQKTNQKGAITKEKSRNFKNLWLDEDIFKRWLAPHPTKDKASCILCNITIRCCRTDLVRHSQRTKY